MKIITFLTILSISMCSFGISENYSKYEYHISDAQGKKFSLERIVAIYKPISSKEEKFFNELYEGKTKYWKYNTNILCGNTPDTACPQIFTKITMKEVLGKEYQNTNMTWYIGTTLAGLIVFMIFVLKKRGKNGGMKMIK